MNGWAKFVSMQNYYNLAYREEEREMLPLCVDQGIGVIPWSPMARGYLVRDLGEETIRAKTDPQIKKWGVGKPDDVGVRDAVIEVAERLGVQRAHVAIAWLLSKPAVTAPIIGATKQSHIPDAVVTIKHILQFP